MRTKNEKADPPEGGSARQTVKWMGSLRGHLGLFFRNWHCLEPHTLIARIWFVMVVLVTQNFLWDAFGEGVAHGLILPSPIEMGACFAHRFDFVGHGSTEGRFWEILQNVQPNKTRMARIRIDRYLEAV